MNKKGFFISVAALLLLFVSCASEQNKYEKAIAAYVQTDKRGTWTDLQFKAKTIEVVSECTVADSLKTLKAAFEKERDRQVASEEQTLLYWQQGLADNEKAKYAKDLIRDNFNTNIAKSQQRIDSLKNRMPEYATRYENRKSEEILAVVIKCEYSYVMPGADASQSRTDSFILSVDGSKVLGKATETN